VCKVLYVLVYIVYKVLYAEAAVSDISGVRVVKAAGHSLTAQVFIQ
jgi:hypothetical protein